MHRYIMNSAIISVLVALTCSAAYAAEANRPAAIEALSTKGVTNIQELKPSGDLRLFVGISRQNPVSIYVTKEGSAIIGMRIDKNAEPMDMATVTDALVKPLNDSTWSQLESAKWIRDGKADAPRTVYVITDPNCPWCHKFWEAARPAVESGKVQLRHILVGIIRPDSPAKAAAILEANNPSEMLEKGERSYSKGGVTALKTVSAESKKTLSANLQLMEQLGFSGTPAIIYKKADGVLGRVNGFPKDRLSEVLGTK